MILRILTLLIAVTIPSWLAAQITLDTHWIAGQGDNVLLWADTANGASLNLGTTGGNQLWDFSSLQAHEDESVVFENPSTAPLFTNFPDADFVINDLQDSSHVFLEKTSDYLDVIGIVEYDNSGSPVLPELQVSSRFIEFPSTLGDTYSDSVEAGTQVQFLDIDPDGGGPHPNIDSIRTNVTFMDRSEIDAWGELDLPGGTFLAIRQQYMQIFKLKRDFYGDGMWQPFTPLMIGFIGDTVQYDTNSIQMRWWSDNPAANFLLVNIEVNTDGAQGDRVSWLNVSPEQYLGTPSPEDASTIQVYPNPANDFISVRSEDEKSLQFQMMDQTGRMVRDLALSTMQSAVDVSDLRTGMYLVQVLDDKGSLVKMQKLSIVR